MNDELTERAARAAYNKYRSLYSPVWGLLEKSQQAIWCSVARAVLDTTAHVPDDNEMNRGFGNCPHCRAPRVAHCHECLNDIDRDAAHVAGWRMDHLSGYGCIAVCPDCRNDNTKEDS
jgi:hypothetical protein